ncbi:hypothetical protein OG763_44425 (plasmid) [Streptomyces sp. NBC_01230]|nr:hypothetical protein OG763_44425 [Streptomyces sp. NBC_01230]
MHKTLAKTIAVAAGAAVLPSVILPDRDRDTVTQAITQTIAFPLILKPLSEGGSIGMAVCHDSAEIAAALSTVKAADGWFAEPFTTGTPVTGGILEVDVSPVALPPLETLFADAEFYDYATKRDKAKYRYRCPAELPGTILDTITAPRSQRPGLHGILALRRHRHRERESGLAGDQHPAGPVPHREPRGPRDGHRLRPAHPRDPRHRDHQ